MAKLKVADTIRNNMAQMTGAGQGSISVFGNESSQAPKPVKTERAIVKLMHIPLDMILEVNNIRDDYDEESILELANSFKEHGQLEPCDVYMREDEMYVLKVGHRRWRAAKIAKVPTLMCLVSNNFKDDTDRTLKQLVENVQRKDISPAEKEKAVKRLIESGMTNDEICKSIGKSAGWVTQMDKAADVREKFGGKFDEKGIPLSSRDAYSLRNSSEEEIDSAVQEIIEGGNTEESKHNALKKIAKGKEGEKRGKKAYIKPEPVASEQEENPDTSAPASSLEIDATFDDENKATLSISTDISLDADLKKYICEVALNAQSGGNPDFNSTEFLCVLNKCAEDYFSKIGYSRNE